MPGAFQGCIQYFAGNEFVVGNENAHDKVQSIVVFVTLLNSCTVGVAQGNSRFHRVAEFILNGEKKL